MSVGCGGTGRLEVIELHSDPPASAPCRGCKHPECPVTLVRDANREMMPDLPDHLLDEDWGCK